MPLALKQLFMLLVLLLQVPVLALLLLLPQPLATLTHPLCVGTTDLIMLSPFQPVLLVFLSSISRTFSHIEYSWSTPVPRFQFFQLLFQPPALGSGWLLLMVPLSPVLAPGLFLYILVPLGLAGLFSWLLYPYPSLEQIFSAITVFFRMFPNRDFFAQPLQPPLRSA